MKRRIPVYFALLTLAAGLWIYTVRFDQDESGSIGSTPHSVPEASALMPGGSGEEPVPERVAEVDSPEARFSLEMARLIAGIEAGHPVRVEVGGVSRDYFFRPKQVTAESFTISAGPDTVFPSVYRVYEGHQRLKDGQLAGQAKLAVVNDTLSMTYANDAGDFLIEANADGDLTARTLLSREGDSSWGQWECVSDGEIAGTAIVDDGARPADEPVVISVAAEEDALPAIEGALADHPYFRLGAAYDASLKDINVLMVSSKSQTGTFSNLSSRAASYFTYAATLADVYERQLGLRFRLQELILIPSDSSAADVESVDIATQNATQQMNFVRDWAAAHRPQASYEWGHVMAWTNVDGVSGGTVGWAWLDSYGSSSSGVSVNEREWTWGVIVHELGHNVGASHTRGGAMNPSVSRSSPREDFFTENSTNGGGYTAATDIYNYMSSPTRSFVFGPAELRNPVEMPFGVDDGVSTAADTPVSFNPLANDLQATPLFGQTNALRLVEVGQVFPKAAGTATMLGNEIMFTPAPGFTGNVWFSYTLSGDVGNGGLGWLHSADVVVTVGGSSGNPSQNPAISLTDDVIKTDFSGPIRLNPLLNDEGAGRLWAGDVEALNFDGGTVASVDAAFRLVGASVVAGNGTVALETAEITRSGLNTQQNTGYLVYTPGLNEPSQVEIQYTVEDANGLQSTGSVFLNFTETVVVVSDVNEIVEREGRVATVTFTRGGSTLASEWIDFSVSGSVDLIGLDSDVAIAGFDTFDAAQGRGRVTIPAGQASVTLTVSAMKDALPEDAEALNFVIADLESLLIDAVEGVATIEVLEMSMIGHVLGSEDFESFPLGTGLANGWTNEATAPGVWTADSGGTPSSGTGPAADHTLGTSSGIYLYREASGHFSEQADLTSPTIDLSGITEATVEFYYHMYGSKMGELRVDVFSGGSWHMDVLPPLVGSQQSADDDPWTRALFDVSNFTTADFKVRFRGITSSFWSSDMAIDDFRVGEPLDPPTQSPLIVAQPQSRDVEANAPVYLSVVAEAFPAPTYQWKKGDDEIPGATRSVYYIEAAQGSDAGDYTCEVTSGSTVTSATATLIVVAPPAPPEGLTAVSEGNTVRLDWIANAEPDLASYTVYRATTPGGPYDEVESDILTNGLNDTDVTQGTTYFYVVTAVDTDTFVSDFSEEAEVTFMVNDFPPLVDAGQDLVVELSGEAPWLPSDVVGLTGWYDASDLSTITQSDGAVSQWSDKSVNALHLSQEDVARQPQSGEAAINGMNTIKFENDRLASSGNPFFPAIEDGFVMAVHKVDATSSGQTLFSLSGSENNTFRWQAHAPWGSTLYFDVNSSSGGRVSSNYGVGIGTDVLVSFYCSTSESVQQVYKDGALLVGKDTANSVVPQGNIFVGSGGGGQYQTTSIGEFIIINGTVTAADRKRLEGYLAHKWGLAGNLPSLHFYKDAPPGGVGTIVNLDGSVSDPDGNPLTTAWTLQSGPAAVSFADASMVDTTVTFSEPGTYVLRLTADDGAFQSFDEVTVTVTAPFVDTDGDGLDDNWEIENFGNLDETAEADSDGDGLSNMLERAFGTHPNDAASRVPMPEGVIMDEGGVDYLTLTYRRLSGGSGTTGVDYTAGGLVYTVEYDTDLIDPWSSGSVVAVGDPIDNGDGTETVTLRLSTAVSDEMRQFIRLKVSAAL